jgi:hypothetical protein
MTDSGRPIRTGGIKRVRTSARDANSSKSVHLKEYRYRIQHACFECRKSFKIDYQSAEQSRRAWLSQRLSGRKPSQAFIEPNHVCPQCSEPLHMMGRAFRAPKHDDLDAWTTVELLHSAGFRFHSSTGYLPTTSREAREFIAAKRPISDGARLSRQIEERRVDKQVRR